MTTNITKSRSGHYTVTIRDGRRVLYKESLLPSLWAARKCANAFKSTCTCMTEDPGDGFGERVVIHSGSCRLHPDFGILE